MVDVVAVVVVVVALVVVVGADVEVEVTIMAVPVVLEVSVGATKTVVVATRAVVVLAGVVKGWNSGTKFNSKTICCCTNMVPLMAVQAKIAMIGSRWPNLTIH